MKNDNSRGLSSTPNNSLQQSYYIAALDRYLGLRGLVSPVHDRKTGLTYDFFHPDAELVVKVFKAWDPKECEHYAANAPEEHLFILDCSASPTGAGCNGGHNNLSEEDHEEAGLMDVILYRHDKFYKWDLEERHWEEMIPIERNRCIDALFCLDDE